MSAYERNTLVSCAVTSGMADSIATATPRQSIVRCHIVSRPFDDAGLHEVLHDASDVAADPSGILIGK